MIITNFQKMGGVVASLVSILAFSSSAQALTFSSPSSTYNIPDNNATGVTASIAISGQGNITNFNSVTISGFNHTWYGDLRAFLSNGATTVQLFRDANVDSASFIQVGADLNGNYTFATTGTDWYTAIDPVPSATTYASFQSLSAFNGNSLNGTWTLNVQDRGNGDFGEFSAFSIDVDAPTATPVPFEFSHQASLVLLGGAFLVRRGLKKKSADNMLAKSVNS